MTRILVPWAGHAGIFMCLMYAVDAMVDLPPMRRYNNTTPNAITGESGLMGVTEIVVDASGDVRGTDAMRSASEFQPGSKPLITAAHRVASMPRHHHFAAKGSLGYNILCVAAVVALVCVGLAGPKMFDQFSSLIGKKAAKIPKTHDETFPEDGLSESSRVDIKLGGMTCSACACTIERCLQGQSGVASVTVNLILERATVVFNTRAVTAAALCEVVEDIGFDAIVLCVGPADRQNDNEARLHVQIPQEHTETVATYMRGINGVRASQLSHPGIARVTYNPSVIGARSILAFARERFPTKSIACAPHQESDQTVELRKSFENLAFNFRWSAIPAAAVFIITIVLPALEIDFGNFDCVYFTMNRATLLVIILATPVQFYFGAGFHVQARKALARGAPNMDVLVSVATNISFIYAVVVLLTQVCDGMNGYHGMNMMTVQPFTRNGPVAVGLGCHALHFFGMSPILIAVVLGGKMMETNAKIHSMQSLVQLMACQSHTAHLVSDDGKEEELPVELVQVGDTLRLFEGCRVPVDGKLATDTGMWVNEAILTGESAPIEKARGSILLGGTTVGSGAGMMEATAVGSKTALGEIVGLISKAQATKTQTQQVANVFASYFVTSVMAFSVAVFMIWLSLVESGRVILPKDVNDKSNVDVILFAAKFGVAVLMVACPCAMGLATPTAVMVSTAVAAKMGCLVKSADALENGSYTKTVVLDKTGTITDGKLSVSGAAIAASPTFTQALCDRLTSASAADLLSSARPPADCFGQGNCGGLSASPEALERALWWCVGVAEAGSDHPVAKCLTRHAQAALNRASFPAPSNFRYTVGRGVSAIVDSGAMDVRVGSMKYLRDGARDLKQDISEDPGFRAVEHWISEKSSSRDSVVVVHAVVERRICVLGALAVRDEVRPEAVAAIRHLQQKLGLEVWMCTGDGGGTARAVALEVGIPQGRVCAEVLPKQKAEQIETLRSTRSGRVCMVGDGVNDAPALAAADVGVAIGAGACLAMDAADVVLIRSDLPTLVAYLELSKVTTRTIYRNFAWAFVFNICGLPLAAGAFYPVVVMPPLVAGLAMSLSSVLVVTSSLMIRHFETPRL
jgi:Cu+-exporting ATPase